MNERPLARASLRLKLGLKPGQFEPAFTQLDIKSIARRRTKTTTDLRLVSEQLDPAAARRDAIMAILDQSTGILFDPQTLKAWLGPVVYVTLRDKQAVYVGMSRHGLKRVFSRHHKPEAFVNAELMVWCVPTAQDAAKLERLLIRGLRPALNQRNDARIQELMDRLGLSAGHAQRYLARRGGRP